METIPCEENTRMPFGIFKKALVEIIKAQKFKKYSKSKQRHPQESFVIKMLKASIHPKWFCQEK